MGLGAPVRLFDGDGFREVARLVHIAAAFEGDIIAEQLDRAIVDKIYLKKAAEASAISTTQTENAGFNAGKEN